MTFEFRCATCDEIHTGMPTFGASAPLSYYCIPQEERATRCQLGSDDCVIDGREFYVRGCIEIPVHGAEESFAWGVWVSLSEASYEQWRQCFHEAHRSDVGPFFGWLNAALQPYPDTVNLKTYVHLLDHGIRPYIELEPTDYPLAVEQRNGISAERLAEIYAMMIHGKDE